VTAGHGTTIARKHNGAVLKQFPSELPGGHRRSKDKHSMTILDCIYNYQTRTYFVLDMMCWKDYLIYDSDTEFRRFWLASKLSEVPVDTESHYNRFRFEQLPSYPCKASHFRTLYQQSITSRAANSSASGSASAAMVSDVPQYCMDGILFYHKKTHYVLGMTPLSLLWKDMQCSPYFIQGGAKSLNHPQTITVELKADRSVVAMHGEQIGIVDVPDLQRIDARPGDLLKFAAQDIDIDAKESTSARFKTLTLIGKASQARVLADNWSKIRFQAMARVGETISVDNIGQALVQQEEEVPVQSASSSSRIDQQMK
jgi:snurportin-1